MGKKWASLRGELTRLFAYGAVLGRSLRVGSRWIFAPKVTPPFEILFLRSSFFFSSFAHFARWLGLSRESEISNPNDEEAEFRVPNWAPAWFENKLTLSPRSQLKACALCGWEKKETSDLTSEIFPVALSSDDERKWTQNLRRIEKDTRA